MYLISGGWVVESLSVCSRESWQGVVHQADPNGAMSQCHFATVPYPASPLVLIYDSHSNGYNQLGTDEKVVGKQTWSVIHQGFK